MAFLFADWLTKPVWMWLSFFGIVVALLSLDLGVLHRKQREIGIRESLALSAFYIVLGIGFGGWIWWELGSEAGKEYVTGFVVEKSLAMDNVFVIAMIFSFFGIPRLYQHRVLFWGILGVILLRGVMIGVGATLVSQFGWLLYVFAAFLIVTGVKMWLAADSHYDIGASPVLKAVRRHFRVTDELHGDRFWIRREDATSGRAAWYMTPLMLSLLMVEFVDVVFAVDSVPAIFAITTDPYIVYTSNIFAILGLRALYFALAAMIGRFHYLKYALSMLLVFIGSKIFVADLAGFEGGKFPADWGLGVTFGILAGGVLWSLWKTRGEHKDPADAGGAEADAAQRTGA
jgi:tellurite resistance protein TerC